MVIVGRITADATVHETKDERKVVHFSIAVNDFYKPKGASEPVKHTTFFNCAYWRNTEIAERLKKGSVVEVSGRIEASAYTDKEGNAKASINCHVVSIKIHCTPKDAVTTAAEVHSEDAADDLPF